MPKFECALCHKSVKLDDSFRMVTITDMEGFRGDPDAATQQLFCHGKCLERALGQNVPIL